jgi:site-specific DNA-methyltransferase (adenine-specific)
MINSYFKSNNNDFTLIQGDCIEVMKSFDFKFDMVFADPPYFLSNNGITIQNGKVASVNKGLWDKSNGKEKDKEFNYAWLNIVKDKLKK